MGDEPENGKPSCETADCQRDEQSEYEAPEWAQIGGESLALARGSPGTVDDKKDGRNEPDGSQSYAKRHGTMFPPLLSVSQGATERFRAESSIEAGGRARPPGVPPHWN